jgi:hypothetical protein
VDKPTRPELLFIEVGTGQPGILNKQDTNTELQHVSELSIIKQLFFSNMFHSVTFAHTSLCFNQLLHSFITPISPQGAAARQRADTRVAPVQGRVPLAGSTGSGQEDSMNTFRCPPRPLPYDDPQFIRQMEQHPLVAGHDKASTQFQKSIQLEESNNSHISSARAAEKAHGSSLKAQSQGQKIGGTQVDVLSDSQDDCPICLEGQ